MPSDIAISVKNLKKIYSTNNQNKKTALDNSGFIFEHHLTTFLCFSKLLPRASTMSPTITVIHGSARRFSQSLEVVSF